MASRLKNRRRGLFIRFEAEKRIRVPPLGALLCQQWPWLSNGVTRARRRLSLKYIKPLHTTTTTGSRIVWRRSSSISPLLCLWLSRTIETAKNKKLIFSHAKVPSRLCQKEAPHFTSTPLRTCDFLLFHTPMRKLKATLLSDAFFFFPSFSSLLSSHRHLFLIKQSATGGERS